MICLGFTTSTDHGSIALLKNKEIIGQTSWTRGQHQSETVIPKIKNILKKNSIKFKDIDFIAVDKGPGSFTGVRIAVNVAKTFSYILSRPIFASNSLDILAHGFSFHRAPFPQEAISLIDAHKFLFYFKSYKIRGPGQVKSEFSPQAQSLEEISKQPFDIKKLFIIGALPSRTKIELKENFHKNSPHITLEFAPERQNFPKASTLVSMVSLVPLDERPDLLTDWRHLEPSYIRSPDAVTKLANPTVSLKK